MSDARKVSKKVGKRSGKNRGGHPFANIQLNKAKQLFENSSPPQHKSYKFPSVKDILCYAAKAAGEGMLFVFEAEERGRAFIHGYDLYEKDVSSWRIKQRIAQMEKQRYITTKKQSDGSITVYITKHGMERALTFKLDSLSLRKPTHWDKKWRIVIFDIPEESKQIRDIFRKRLRQLNLYQLQKSVYVSPYQCFDEIEFLRELYGVPMRVRYILAERIEDDRMLLQYFGLSD